MGISSMRMPRFFASETESSTLPREEYIDGMVMPVTLSAPSASTASAAVSAESMPPDSPMTTFENPHLRT